jgi:hypothetical protein
MGSNTVRKHNDRPRINLPLENGGNPLSGGGNGGGAPVDVNNVCPPAFQVRLAQQDIAVGTELVLNERSIRLASNQSVEVGMMPASQMKRIQKCLGMGITYNSMQVVRDKKGVYYAEVAQ